MNIRNLIALTGLLSLAVSGAQAATVTDGLFTVTTLSEVNSTNANSYSSSILIDGVGPVLAGNATIAVGPNISSGVTNIGLGWNPYGPSSGDTHSWISLGMGGVLGTASYSLNQPTTSIEFVWGSPSPGNQVSFFNGNTLVGTVDYGDSAIQSLNLSNAVDDPSGYLTEISSTQAFQSVVFSGNQQAFELGGTQVSPVPLPAALPMFGAALLGLGGLARRRAKKVA